MSVKELFHKSLVTRWYFSFFKEEIFLRDKYWYGNVCRGCLEWGICFCCYLTTNLLAFCCINNVLGWSCSLSWEGAFPVDSFIWFPMLYPVKLIIISYDCRNELWNIFVTLSGLHQFLSIQHQGIACVDCRKMLCIGRSSLKNTQDTTMIKY